MRIQGLQKLTLLDYPGKTACTVFLSGCNFRCPFCHNTPLLTADAADGMAEEERRACRLRRHGRQKQPRTLRTNRWRGGV